MAACYRRSRLLRRGCQFRGNPANGSISAPRILGEDKTRHGNAYLYCMLTYPKALTWSVGLSADFADVPLRRRDQLNPKFGLTWTPSSSTTFRAAAFRVLERSLVSEQTLEPTQVAGFNQFYEDGATTDSWRYGIGWDQRISEQVHGGLEWSRRDIDIPFQGPPPAPQNPGASAPSVTERSLAESPPPPPDVPPPLPLLLISNARSSRSQRRSGGPTSTGLLSLGSPRGRTTTSRGSTRTASAGPTV